jgi:NAD(P)H-hydrate repair Nnr-like enzyme with NAD(P)H-hydrate epimerase domain
MERGMVMFSYKESLCLSLLRTNYRTWAGNGPRYEQTRWQQLTLRKPCPVNQQFGKRYFSGTNPLNRARWMKRKHRVAFDPRAEAGDRAHESNSGENDILAEWTARLTPRQLHYKESATGSQTDALPRALTRTEQCLLLQELVPKQLSVEMLIQQLCRGTLPVLKQLFGTQGGRILIFAGPWFTGLYGIELATHLAKSGFHVKLIAAFEPDVEYFTAVSRAEERRWFSTLRDSWHVSEHRSASLAAACEAGVELLDFIPRTLDYYFDLIIDALTGVDIDLYTERDPSETSDAVAAAGQGAGYPNPALMMFAPMIEVLALSRLPLISIDVPCGWDVLRGPRILDIQRDRFLKPEILICLGTPKRVIRYFGGNHVYLVGDVIPPAVAEQRKLRLPQRLQSDGFSLISVNPYLDLIQRHRKRAGLPDKNPRLPLSWGKANTGELYGHPGEYIATVFAERIQREWVDVDANPDLWDEID